MNFKESLQGVKIEGFGIKNWRDCNEVYLIMWKSDKTSGACLSEIRKTEYGKNKLIRTLKYIGITDIKVTIVTKEKF